MIFNLGCNDNRPSNGECLHLALTVSAWIDASVVFSDGSSLITYHSSLEECG
jgi:hypothetical protein